MRRAAQTAAAAFAIAIVVMIAVWFPRPAIRITDARIEPGPCDEATTTRSVTATFNLMNAGAADGFFIVRLLVDRVSAAVRGFTVPAKATVPGQLAATVSDCAVHAYTLEGCYPDETGFC